MDSALRHHQAGRLAEAEHLYQKILTIYPDHISGLHNLGLIALERGQHEVAITLIAKAIAVNDRIPECHNSLGNALCAIDRWDDAVAHYNKALILNPEHAEAYSNLGNALKSQGKLDEGIARFRRAIILKPDLSEAHNNLGNALRDQGKLDEALAHYQRASIVNPSFTDTHNNFGTLLLDRGDPERAVTEFKRVLALNPDHVEANNNLGNALKKQGKWDEALPYYQRALTLKPDYAEAHNNLGNTLKELRKIDEAIRRYERALAVKPGFAEAHFNFGLALLLNGQLEKGWSEYEWRWRSVNKNYKSVNFTQPRWRGEPLSSHKVLLLHAEQGLGDTIQYCRYVSLAAARARVILEVPRSLMRLLSSVSGVEDMLAIGDALPSFDFHCPLLSLPKAFKTTLDNIPAAVPYLRAKSARVSHWRGILGDSGFRIGIVWQVNPKSETELRRSIPRSCFAQLAKFANVRLISLQKTRGLNQFSELTKGVEIEDLGPDFDSGPDAFLDTAAVMENLDLVITVDTAAAHLAGALGRPTWILLRHVPHWTWMLDRDGSPWYPTVRLFRQQRKDDWRDVFSKVENELRLITD